ncbi:hypothetical protein R6U77_18335 [Lysinibacillus louembei]|uniref:Uncharacterized protein n=1 Tax=Lysinibacillus louembei TaxID=1470088 RepID=A0ABZ0RX51_9BACI|nr:hypothetical protein [Lysinibacillus louembei]WPK11827.1 hypothetical protein R6U77_18335 [Lysinibacillus louembei]
MKKNRRIYFWKNDADGLSQQDFIVLLMSAVLFGGIGFGLIIVIIGMFLGFELSTTYIDLIRVLDIPFATVIAGIFTVKTASAIVNRKMARNAENDEDNGGF